MRERSKSLSSEAPATPFELAQTPFPESSIWRRQSAIEASQPNQAHYLIGQPINSLGTIPHRRASTFSTSAVWGSFDNSNRILSCRSVDSFPLFNTGYIMQQDSRPSVVSASQQTQLEPLNSNFPTLMKQSGENFGINKHSPFSSFQMSSFPDADNSSFGQTTGFEVSPENTLARHFALNNKSLQATFENQKTVDFENSLAPNFMLQNDPFPDFKGVDSRSIPRRHSVAGSSNISYRIPGRNLTEAFGNLRFQELGYLATDEDNGKNVANNSTNNAISSINSSPSNASLGIHGKANFDIESMEYPVPNKSALVDGADFLDHSMVANPMQSAIIRNRSESFSEVGRGVPLHALPSTTPLYVVEFKAGRSDIYYVAESTGLKIIPGDLVIVEGDRGKDLGKVTSSVTLHQVHMLQAQQDDALNDLHRVNREIHPKRIFRHANPEEVVHMVTKSQDEAKALSVCLTKVRQKKLDMEVVDAEYQWDRRKLTFYFVSKRRIDFRELVHDLFKIYKTRIWMNAVPSRINIPDDDEEIKNIENHDESNKVESRKNSFGKQVESKLVASTGDSS